jgi:hypothetical protein
MSFHLLAYTGNVGTTPNTDLPSVVDDVVPVQNNHFLLSRDRNLLFAVAIGATITRQRIVQPSLRQIVEPQIHPLVGSATPGDDANVADYSLYPLRIRALEELSVESSSGIAMGTERHYSLLGLEEAREPTPGGDIYTMRGVSSTAAVANTWTTLTTTWDVVLPEGIYGVVGFVGAGSGAIAYRLIFEDQRDRPGSLALQAVTQKPHRIFKSGNLGVWGRFRNYAMPQVQVLSSTTTNTHTLFMDLIRLR